MNTRIYLIVSLVVSAAGVAFSGYLSAFYFLRESCAFNEVCPRFLGYPACWFGLAIFLAMLIAALLAAAKRIEATRFVAVNAVLAFVGLVFSGYFTTLDVMHWSSGTIVSFALGLPTCAFVLVAFFTMFVISI